MSDGEQAVPRAEGDQSSVTIEVFAPPAEMTELERLEQIRRELRRRGPGSDPVGA